jgi:hypothetical protein
MAAKKAKAPEKTVDISDKSPAALKDASKDRSADIERALASIKTKFGDDSIMMLGQQAKVGVDSISTGSLGVDVGKVRRVALALTGKDSAA